MGLLRQTNTLFAKDIKIVVQRRWLSTALRAWIMPVLYMLFIAYVKNFFLPPSHYGIGQPRLIRDLTTEVFNSSLSLGGRNKVAFVDNGFTGGEIGTLISSLSDSIEAAGMNVQVLSSDDDLLSVCQSSLSGRSSCYAAASFHSSPTEGPAGEWSYTARVDAGLGLSVFVDSANNAAQIYVLPFLQAIDSEIARLSGSQLPSQMLEQPFTYETIQDRNNEVQQVYTGALANYLAVTLFIALCGIPFHLAGYIAVERESGLSSLVDVMSHDSRALVTLVARLVSAFASFSLIYAPAWLSVGGIVSSVVFPATSPAIIVPFHVIFGLALTAYSLFLGSFFKKAQLSGVTALILSLVIAIVSQFVPRTPVAVAVLSAVFPPAAYTSFSIQLAQWEHQLLAANLSSSPPNQAHNGIPGFLFFVFVGSQALIYLLLAAIVQWTFHRTSGHRSRQSHVLVDANTSVRLVNVSKTFKGGALFANNHVQAVNGLSLKISRGQLVSLLGVNGSGKSTLLACLTGTQSFSSGEVGIAPDHTIGLCPQQNVTWDDLTVLENARIFSRLKTTASISKDMSRSLLSRCDIIDKEDKRPSTLSGGQKRKLQLALAFAGNSTLCCIDEASSGLDPLSRRKIWDILLAERKRRTIVFTTHALDEADALADHIAIMSLGRLVVEGSSAELKERFGGGYHVDIRTQENLPSRIGNARRRSDGGNDVYTVSDSAEASEIIRQLDERAGDFDVSVRSPTMEDVFLNIGSQSPNMSYETVLTKDGRIHHEGNRRSEGVFEKIDLHNQPGRGSGFWRQVCLLHWKRWIVARRNFMPYIFALAVPIITAAVAGHFFLKGFNGIPCTQGAISTRPYTLDLPGLEACCGIKIPVGPLDRLPRSSLPAGYESYRRYLRPVNSYDEFESYIERHFRTIDPGGYYVGANDSALTLMAYRINGGLGYAALAKNLADQYLANIRIRADFSTFALPISGAAGDSLQFILYISLALCAFPAFLTLYPTYEKLRNVRALHYSCGVTPATLWLGYALFDGLIVLVTSVVVIIILTTLSNVWYAPAYLCIAFILYGLCSMMVAYIVSLFAKTLLSAFAFVAGFQAVSMTLYFVIYLLLLTFGSQERLESDLTTIQFTYGFLSPAGSLFRAMLLTLNQSQLLCRNHSLITYPANIGVYGGPYLCLTLQIIACYFFLVRFDSGRLPKIKGLRKTRPQDRDAEKVHDQIEDSVTREEQSTEVSNDALRVLHISKQFGRGKNACTAVEDATFGVPRGGVLALLGPNGAGKTTTMGLIRGDLKPSERTSDILLSGHSIITDKLGARNHLGVCPQFNSADLMTVKSHLEFYARVRGARNVSNIVVSTMHAVGLTPYRSRLTTQLSGGNQRKLHLATAIIGSPAVVILDEPSSGMDAIAMRSMWKAIKDVSEERAVVITTHSMEEASTLASKVAIMDSRILTVGSPSVLRDRYGKDTFQIHVVHRNGATASAQDMESIRDWILQHCHEVQSGSIMHGQLRLLVLLKKRPSRPQAHELEGYYGEKQTVSPLRELLQALEQCKQLFGAEHYSVHPLTLEDVFLRIVQRPEDAVPLGS